MALEQLLASLRPGGRDFERLCKWMLENVPEYRQKLSRVWVWDEWPGRWGIDAGIDLVAEDHEGGLWAVQAKHYDPAYAIKKADLDSFLSESSRPGFSYRLVIASTDHVGPTARRTLDAQEKPVGTLLRSQLEALDVAWPKAVTRLRPAKQKRKRPRPHQRRAIADCASGLAGTDRGQLVMACGTGKTLVGPFLAERMAAKRVLVLVPSLSLLAQTLREWTTVTGWDWLAVCSDETVTKDEHDAVVASTSELGVPVTTDAERIARFLRRRGTRRKVVFATYQSSPQIAAAQADRSPAFDLVIADEAHRCTGPQAGVFTTVLDRAKIKARKRLFMTATPRYFTGRVKKEAAEADWEVASMDEEEKFGPVLHRLTFGQAIDQDLLSDYQVVVVGVTDREALDLAEKGAFVSPDGERVTDARTLARQIGLLRSMAKYDLHRIVTFHSRIDYASRFASSLPETKEWMPTHRSPKGSLWTGTVSGKMTAGERDLRLRQLKAMGGGERGVLTNARCLTEGVDVPTLDGVAFIDPRRSQVDVVQAVGRAIRKAEDKTLGSVVIPVLVEEDESPEDALESGEFDRVWEIVRALRDHDEDLAEELDELRRGMGLRGSVGQRPRKIVLDVPVGIGSAFAEAFDAKVVERATASWEFWFGFLERFVTREGHARPPKGHIEEGIRLGQWTANQRTNFKTGRLDADRIRRLEKLPGWAWNAYDVKWEESYKALRAFAEREGHTAVPADWVEAGTHIGHFANNQRSRKKRGELSAEEAVLLEAIPEWSWDPISLRWEEGFSYLLRYVERTGHAQMLQSHIEDGFALGRWVVKRRSARSRGSLSPDRIAQLEALPGWTWDSSASRWEQGFTHLERYVEREGQARVPKKHLEDGFRLGQWAAVQRTSHAKGRLAPDRTARLEAIPGWTWDPAESAWDNGFSYLSRYVAREGDARVHQAHREDGFPLGQWISAQRQAHRRQELLAERVTRLEALAGWTWDTLQSRWEEGFSHLERFVEREGHSRVAAQRRENGFRLGQWVSEQRGAYKRGKVPAERVTRLEALPGWTWDARKEPAPRASRSTG